VISRKNEEGAMHSYWFLPFNTSRLGYCAVCYWIYSRILFV